MKRHIILALAALLSAAGASAQAYRFTGDEWQDPSVGSIGTAPKRSEFISFDTRPNAEKGKRTDSPFYKPFDVVSLTGSNADKGVAFDIPFLWLDREVFLHVAGLDPYYVQINGRTIGYAGDTHAPAEFNISQWLVDGQNTLKLNFPREAAAKNLESPTYLGRTPEVFIYSQPKIRIEDFSITAGFDSTGKHCILDVAAVVSNSYNSDETFRLDYDLYTPDGKTLIYYDIRDVTLPGKGTDTIRFREPVSIDMKKNLWSAETPVLYRFMFNINYDKRWIEYIPFRVGFGETTFKGDTIYRNGKAVKMKTISGFNSAMYAEPWQKLREYKKMGYNTVWPHFPQTSAFYDICDEIGLYVIEQVNINSEHMTDDRNVGGAYSNDPKWLNAFMDRTMAARARMANRPCVIAWSLGGEVGNGYNMYKTYQWLKSQDDSRPVIFSDAQGEWNSDMDLLGAEEVPTASAPTAAPARK